MALRFYKAYTPGTRNRSVTDCTELTKTRPEKSLTRSLHRPKGRNNRGVITCRHRGGGHKRLYRQIDFRRNKYDMSASVKILYGLYSSSQMSYGQQSPCKSVPHGS